MPNLPPSLGNDYVQPTEEVVDYDSADIHVLANEINIHGDEQYQDEEGEQEEYVDPIDWLGIARQSYRDSTDFLDAGLRDRWKRNYSLANSKHPAGSKYYTDAYRSRSKNFRGKTAAAIRQNESACAVALFSTVDYTDITAINPDVEEQVVAAKAIKQLVNERLENDIPWFLTCQGAYKDVMTVGTVVSKQYWKFEEKQSADGLLDPIKSEDKPVIELIPIENCRLSPAANWIDPINSSPYFIHMIPMYLADVKARQDWIEYPNDVIQSATKSGTENDSIRREREGVTNQDPKSSEVSSVQDHDIVWVHEVFLRHEDEEFVYYTLGTDLILSQVMLLEEAYPHCIDGKRPFAFGSADVAAHTVYRKGLPERVEGSQARANNISNQRYDNVEQVLNKQKHVRRGANIDYRALRTRAPGVTVEMDQPGVDVVSEDMQDVTSSSYQEQNYSNMDFDEEAGVLSNSVVASNTGLSERVGNMQIMDSNANVITEYQLRIFVETWVEPVIRQIVKMVQGYEDEQTILQVTGKPLTQQQIATPIKCRVSVGFGATDPTKKVQKLMMGLETLAKINPEILQEADYGEIVSEVFGALGWRDGLRFFPSLEKKEGEEEQPDQQLQKMQEQIQQLQQYIQTQQAELESKERITDKNNKTKLQIEALKIESKDEQILAESYAKRELELDKLAITEGTKRDTLEQKHGIDSDKLTLDSAKEMNRQADIMNTTAELEFKMNTGKDGI